MATGVVVWFSAARGFGFIGRDGGEDLFVHFSSIQGDGFRTLKPGMRVTFDVVPGDKGMRAENVRLVESHAVTPEPLVETRDIANCSS